MSRQPIFYLNKSSAVAEMGDRGHNRHGPKIEDYCALSRELGPRLVQCGLSRDLLPYQVASSSIQPFGHNRHGPKIGWGWSGVPFSLGVAGSTSNKMSPRPSSTFVPSGILIHAAVWRFGHNRRGPKIGWGSAPYGVGAGSPSNTVA